MLISEIEKNLKEKIRVSIEEYRGSTLQKASRARISIDDGFQIEANMRIHCKAVVRPRLRRICTEV
jgi:hypothetical protein